MAVAYALDEVSGVAREHDHGGWGRRGTSPLPAGGFVASMSSKSGPISP